ncbi:MAG: LutB/LldF family L-lactate oxidation iron-sulfur protein [bacterium]|nr:iron-sulfur cluster-binding protein [Gammaproteobacteria bacterium]HIL95894.1 iron-sulfur cluster-binding protein [Pseudomonadales bacterium]
MDVSSENFIPLAKVALDNQDLQNTLGLLGKGLGGRRAEAATALPEFEQLRDEARDIKNHTLAHLDLYLEKFEQQVMARGGTVHWASTDDEARQMVLDICQQNNARHVTKSKSMVTEELDLVPFLEDNGLETVETDLGEYIIQLRHERPSHIVAPAVHLTKADVSDTFFEHHRKLGFNEKLEARADLVGEARNVLRSKFLQADVGISGANFLVAETGSIVLVTNEGNAELTTSLVDTHIVVTGIEKVVPTMEDVSTFVRVLARSAIGMEISTYTSFVTGPRREGDMDGPKNFHVVLVDNGRSNMLGTQFQDMLRCIRCSACLHHCPVYLSVGGHAYGSVYNGPMGAVLTPQLATLNKAAHLPNASTFCGRCEEVCPVRIPLPKLMRFWRNREMETKTPSAANDKTMRWGLAFWAWMNRNPAAHRVITAIVVAVLSRFGSAGFIRQLPGVAGNWTKYRDLHQPEGKTFMQLYRATMTQRKTGD